MNKRTYDTTTWIDSDANVSTFSSATHGRALYDVSTYNEDALNSTHARRFPARFPSLGWPVKTTFDAERYARDDGAVIKKYARHSLTRRNVPHFEFPELNFRKISPSGHQKETDRSNGTNRREITPERRQRGENGRIEWRGLSTSRLISRFSRALSVSFTRYELLCSIDAGAVAIFTRNSAELRETNEQR